MEVNRQNFTSFRIFLCVLCVNSLQVTCGAAFQSPLTPIAGKKPHYESRTKLLAGSHNSQESLAK